LTTERPRSLGLERSWNGWAALMRRCLGEKGRSRVNSTAGSCRPHRRGDARALPGAARREATSEGERDALHAALLPRHDPLAEIRDHRATQARDRCLAPDPACLGPTTTSTGLGRVVSQREAPGSRAACRSTARRRCTRASRRSQGPGTRAR